MAVADIKAYRYIYNVNRQSKIKRTILKRFANYLKALNITKRILTKFQETIDYKNILA